MTLAPDVPKLISTLLKGMTCLVQYETRRLLACGHTLEEAEKNLKLVFPEDIDYYIYVFPRDLKMDLEQLKKQAEEANAKYKDALNQQDQKNLLSLEWISGCDAVLQIDSIHAYGIPRYKIRLAGNIPSYHGQTTLINYKNYYDSIYYCSNYFGYCGGLFDKNYSNPTIYTYNKDSLINFLNSVKFKSFTFNDEDLELLNKLNDYRKKYE